MAKQEELFDFKETRSSRSFISDLYDIIGLVVIGGVVYYAVKNTNIVEQIQNFLASNPIKLPQIVIDGGTSGGGGAGRIGDSGGGSLPAAGTTIWKSTSWSNGKARTLTQHEQFDPYDKQVFLAAGSNKLFQVDGKGVGTIGGDQVRIYIVGLNYNSRMVLDGAFIGGASNDNFSLRLRSNHGGQGFGGYGCSFHLGGELGFSREDCHDCNPSHTDFGSVKIPAFKTNTFYNMGFTVQDSGNTVVMKAYLGGKLVGTAIDKKPTAPMLNKSTNKKSWIRHNGSSGKISIKNVTISEIGPLASSNYAQAYPARIIYNPIANRVIRV